MGLGGIHRRGDGIEVKRRKERGQQHKNRKPGKQKYRFPATAARHVALDFHHLGQMGLFGARFGRGKLGRFHGLRLADAIAAGRDGQRARARLPPRRSPAAAHEFQHRIGLERVSRTASKSEVAGNPC